MKVPMYDIVLNEDNRVELIKTNTIEVRDYYEQMDEKGRRCAELAKEYIKLDKFPNERVFAFSISPANKLLGICEIAKGSVDHSVFDAKSLFQFLILTNGAKLCVIHNHPYGIPEPSPADILGRVKCSNICESLDSKYIGSYIITSEGKIAHF